MIYLSGVWRAGLRGHPRVGLMKSMGMGNAVPSGVAWAADNGRFASPALYTDELYLAWLARHPSATCLFATAPDVLGDHDATVELSLPMLPRIRDAGYRAAFVGQDGWREETTPWGSLDVLFLGGTTAWKLGAASVAVEAAHRRGVPVHMGRVNSFKRLRLAAAIGCQSADGTRLRFEPTKNEGALLRWLARLEASPMLPMRS